MKIFVEYLIHEESKAIFEEIIEKLIANYSNVEVYEGTDQENLFVEIWNDRDFSYYEELKQERQLSSLPIWKELNNCIVGGAVKLHMWHFTNTQK